jgi:energy-coupling factor transporter ATP-binding protein EcfA2
MRELPKLWTGVARIQYLCAFLESIGVDSLHSVPLITSGFKSLLTTDLFREQAQALFNLRVMGLNYSSEPAIRRQAALYNEAVDDPRSNIEAVFEINPETLKFSRLANLIETQVTQALAILRQPLPYKKHGKVLIDPKNDSLVPIEIDRETQHIAVYSPSFEALNHHNLNRNITNDIEIPIAELIKTAINMDRMDKNDPEKMDNNWQKRLEHSVLCQTTAQTLPEAKTLHLKEVIHLIGLPGSGKTTLLTCLAVYLARKKIKILMLFPKIETALNYLNYLKYYQVNVSLLSGQSYLTRDSHANRIAETIAARGESGGFGMNVPGSEYFGKSCALAGFAIAQEEANRLSYGYAPCENIHQATARHKNGRYKNLLCSGWYRCGRNKAPRDLINADVWLGHILSTTPAVSAHAIAEKIRYLELIAASFDVVIIDEVDNAQQTLDKLSLSEIILSGDANSFHNRINEQSLKRTAAQGLQRLNENPEFPERAHAFSIFTQRLFRTIVKLSEDVQQEKKGHLMTTLNLIKDIVMEAKPNKDNYKDNYADVEKINRFWISIICLAIFDNNELEEIAEESGDEEWMASLLKAGSIPELPNLSPADTERFYGELIRLSMAVMKPTRHIDNTLEKISETFLSYIFQEREITPRARELGRLLVSISFSIISYKALQPILKEMVALERIPPETVHTQPPVDILRLTTANIVGALAGVKFEIPERSEVKQELKIRVKQLAFEGAPRIFLYRLYNLLHADSKEKGPAVLLTSATSFLKPASAYHIDIGPDYLLRPQKQKTKPREQTTYTFLPAIDESGPEREAIRVSGISQISRRNKNLTRLVDHILKEGEDSYVLSYMAEFDAEPHPRKVGIVVNSYDQAKKVKEHIRDRYPEINRQTMAVVKHIPDGSERHEWITSAQVEVEFADNPQFNILIFPMRAIGRGTNIVFSDGPRKRDAAIGQLYFLTRPHPTPDDQSFLVSLAGQASQNFDSKSFPSDASLDDLFKAWREARKTAYDQASILLNNPLRISMLGKLATPFVANLCVDIIQTIGRAMRGGMPCRVFFVDAAWAPCSALGEKDNNKTSMLIQMREILHQVIHDANPIHAEIARELYEEFYDPLCRVEGLIESD